MEPLRMISIRALALEKGKNKVIVKPYMGNHIIRAMYGSIKTSFGLLLDSLLVISFKSRL